MKRILISVVLFSICLCFLFKTSNQSNQVYVCPLENEMLKDLVQYRYQLLCNSTLVDCRLNHEFYKDAYSEFVILLHNRNWNFIKNIIEHLSYCNVKFVLVDVVELNADIISRCSVAQTTLLISLTSVNNYSTQIQYSDTGCITKIFQESDRLQNYISSMCPKTVWLTGTVDCQNLTSFGEKILDFDNQSYVIRDKQLGRTFLKNKHLRISMIESGPYCFPLKGRNLNGNVTFAGILNNLLEKISSNLQFTYSIYFPEDSKYGGMNEDKKTWNGMVGDLLRNRTDMILADFTVTYERSLFIDFTLPFQFESIGILIKQPNFESKMWKMFSLFTYMVWLAILISLFVSSFVVYGLHQFSAIPVNSPFKKFSECLWLAISCFSNQGSEYDPETWSTQNFMALFWLYVFAMLSIYSGGLIAMLTSSRMLLPFKDLEGLSLAVKQGQFKVCVTSGTAFHSALMKGDGFYGPLRDWLNENPSFMTTDQDCASKLKTLNDMAYLNEIAFLESVQQESCKDVKLILLNDRFFPGYFAIGLPKNSPLNEIFSEQLTTALNGGLILGWMKNFSVNSIAFCDNLQPDAKVNTDSNDLTLEEFTGPFVLLGIGIATSFFGLAWEIYRHLRSKKGAIKIDHHVVIFVK